MATPVRTWLCNVRGHYALLMIVLWGAGLLGTYLALAALWVHAQWPYCVLAALAAGQLIQAGLTASVFKSLRPYSRLLAWWKEGFAYALGLLAIVSLLLRVAGRA